MKMESDNSDVQEVREFLSTRGSGYLTGLQYGPFRSTGSLNQQLLLVTPLAPMDFICLNESIPYAISQLLERRIIPLHSIGIT